MCLIFVGGLYGAQKKKQTNIAVIAHLGVCCVLDSDAMLKTNADGNTINRDQKRAISARSSHSCAGSKNEAMNLKETIPL